METTKAACTTASNNYNKKLKGCKRDILPSPSVGRWFDSPPPRCGVGRSEAAGSGGGGASCIAALTHLALHHHLPGNAGDLTICYRTRNPRLQLCLLSQRGHPRLLPKEETGPPVSRVLLGESWVMRDDLSAVLRTAARAAAGRRADAPSVVVSGCHKRTARWNGCHSSVVGRCWLCLMETFPGADEPDAWPQQRVKSVRGWGRRRYRRRGPSEEEFSENVPGRR